MTGDPTSGKTNEVSIFSENLSAEGTLSRRSSAAFAVVVGHELRRDAVILVPTCLASLDRRPSNEVHLDSCCRRLKKLMPPTKNSRRLENRKNDDGNFHSRLLH